MYRHLQSITAIAVVTVLVVAQAGLAGKTIFLGDKSTPQRVAYHQVDHAEWNGLLQKYVDADGMVDYRGLKANASDSGVLTTYLTRLSSVDPKAKSTREAKLAFWINAYNAVTLHGMLREYPTSSIRNHTAKLFGYNIWKDLQLYVGGSPYSLDDMEHLVLRKMNEPRIHFAVVCASKGCPRLFNEAYVADRMEEQLQTNAKDFFSRPTNFQHNGSQLGLSSILQWYGEDFGSDQDKQLKAYAAWFPTPEAQQTATSGTARVSYLDYDWSINEQPAKR